MKAIESRPAAQWAIAIPRPAAELEQAENADDIVKRAQSML